MACLLSGVIVLSAVTSSAGAVAWVPTGGDADRAQVPTPFPRGNVLFADDFATFSNRWRESDSPKATVAYRNGALTLRVVSPGVSAWSTPDFGVALERYALEVAVEFLGGGRDGQAGIIVGYQDDEHFQAVLVTAVGTWQFVQRDGVAWIDRPPLNTRPVRPGRPASRLRLQVEVYGDLVTLRIDERWAGSVALDNVAPGTLFGLIARAGRGYVDVAFDDIVVTDLAGIAEP